MILKATDSGEAVRRLQQWLNFLPNPAVYLTEDGKFGEGTRYALMEFQSAAGLKADGVFGRASYKALRETLHRKYSLLMGCVGLPKLAMPADRYGAGYNGFRLRADAAYWYRGFYDELSAVGALVTSSGSDRSLDAKVSAARSPTSMHYIATAFDLFVYGAMLKPETDPYVIEKDGEYWRVWARCKDGMGELRTIANPITYAKRTGTQRPVTGYFVDLTAIADKYHYKRIKPRASFFAGGSEMGGEWWHFQNEFVLFPLYSTFGEELATLHSADAIQKSPLRQYAERTFKKDWF